MNSFDGIHEEFEGDVQYPYADIGGPEMLHISKVTAETRNSHKYICPYCKKELRPRLGSKNAHCFAHKKGESCELDRYIHSTAERLLKEKWDRDEPFRVWFNVRAECPSYATCPFRRDYDDACVSVDKKVFDLKKSYNRCEVEKKYGEFIPDLCLIDDSGKRKPIFIEIWSKHKNSEKKADSEHQIIEIRIRTIKELEELPKHMIIESDNVTFSHFKTVKKKPKNAERRNLVRYILYKTLKSYVDQEKTNCGNYLDEHHPKSMFEIVFDKRDISDTYQFWNYCDLIAIDRGYNIRKCSLCQYYGTDNINKSANTYDHNYTWGCKRVFEEKGLLPCKQEDAKTCESFTPKEFLVKIVKSRFDDLACHIWSKDGEMSSLENR